MSSSAVGESSSSVSRWVGSRYGSISYSPVSQMSRLPVVKEAVSMRWFCEGISFCTNSDEATKPFDRTPGGRKKERKKAKHTYQQCQT